MYRLSLALLLLLAAQMVTVKSSAARYARAVCAPRTAVVGHGFGAPDDLALSGTHILFSDTRAGTIGVIRHGVPVNLVSGLSVPEGIVVRSKTRIVVAEQGKNRLLTINLKTGARRVLLTLPNTTGLEGVDGIGPAPRGGLYVPDSPNGRVYRVDSDGTSHLIADGMGRPAGVTRFRKGIAVADENAHAVWSIQSHHLTRLATLPSPDDVAVIHGALVAITLLDGTLWEAWPHLRPLVRGFGELQGLVTLNSDAVLVADSKRNAIFKVSGLSGCL